MAADAYQRVMSDEHFRLYLIERDMAKSDHATRLYETKQEGKQEGKLEGFKQAKLDDAKKMLDDGMSIELILRYTGLSRDELKELK